MNLTSQTQARLPSNQGVRPLDGGATFSLSSRLYRIAWAVTWAGLGSWTPPPLHGWRRLLLALFGAKLSRTARVYGSARVWSPRNLVMDEHACLGREVDCYNVALVHLGPRALVSQGAYLCSAGHDYGDPDFPLTSAPISVGAGAWIAAQSFVGPGVTVGEGAILGARAVATRDVKPWTVCAGNPAVFIKDRVRPET